MHGSALTRDEATAERREHALELAVGATLRRVRLQRALDTACSMAVGGVGIAVLAVCAAKLGRAHDAEPLFAVAAALPLLGAGFGFWRAQPPLLGARLLDRALETPDLLASAWSFLRTRQSERTRFMSACITHAGVAAERAKPALAAPLRVPRALLPAVALGLGLALLAALEVPGPKPPAPRIAAKLRVLGAEDVAAAEEALAALRIDRATDPAVADTARALNALIEALRDETLDREEALRELRELERRLEGLTASDDQSALREALQALGKSLERDALARAVAEAFEAGDAERASRELERLAEALQAQAPSGSARRALADALERAGRKRESSTRAELDKAHSELDHLLKKKAQQGSERDAQQERLLHKKQRELEHLEREQVAEQRAERQLERLSRELDAAGRSVSGGQNSAAGDHLKAGADALSAARQRQASAEQGKKLREQLQQLRELISKQPKQGGEQRRQNAANGRDAGAGSPQRLELSQFGRAARGEADKSTREDQGGQGEPKGTLPTPGAGGEAKSTLIMPGQENTGEGALRSGEPVVSDAPGSDGKPQRDGKAQPSVREHMDTRVRGQATAGATRSEVILEAGQHGFATREYQRVHGEYERHAEAVLERDKVPGGYRFYVRRYFELIRPREAKP